MTEPTYTPEQVEEMIQDALAKADKCSCKWTKEKPTRTGHYWHIISKRPKYLPHVIEVFREDGELWVYQDTDTFQLTFYNGYFSDEPIPEPEWSE